MAKLHDVSIVMEAPGRGTVVVDGMPLCVNAFSMSSAKGDMTYVTVTLLAATVNKADAKNEDKAGPLDVDASMKQVDDEIESYRKRLWRRLKAYRG